MRDSTASRRAFLRNTSLAAGTLMARGPFAWTQNMPIASLPSAASGAKTDTTLEISEIEWELAPKKKIRTTAYNGQIPGPLVRVTEGKPV